MGRPRLYLFVGFPGSGKTTAAQSIAEATGAVHIWADHERHQMFKNPQHTYEESRKLYDHLNERAMRLLDAGQSVIFDTNFNYRRDRRKLERLASEHGADTIIIWVTTERDLARYRAVEDSHDKATRVWGNMPADSFERIAGNLQPPAEDETFIKIDGRNIDFDELKRQLAI